MDVLNYSPFPHLVFESRTAADARFRVLVLRGTFSIVPGAPLRPTMKQDPVALLDQHRGKPGRSSLSAEADIAPVKPRSDIHVHAVARAPEGKPAIEWPISVRVGKIKKDLLVRGPYFFQHSVLGGWMKTPVARCTEVPVCYERAFGGAYQVDGERRADNRNPVGTGWIERWTPRDADIPGPQILALDDPEPGPGVRLEPQGIGPISPGWQPRLARAGTFDEGWLKAQWPRLPKDFDFAFYNSAHPDLIYPGYLAGDETVDLVHLSPAAAALRFQLPGYRLMALVRHHTGALAPVMLALDTVHVDVSHETLADHRVHLTWRGFFPIMGTERIVEVRMDKVGAEPMTIPLRKPLEVE